MGKKLKIKIRAASAILCFSIILLSMNFVSTAYAKEESAENAAEKVSANNVVNDASTVPIDEFEVPENIIPLSKHGKNVIVFMLDRAISWYVPFIFEEKPELLESFDGFIYYPNTVCFGQHTNYAVPPLFGGYEYTPLEMNARDTELLADKHDEALTMLPNLFKSRGYKVTVTDPPYAGYDEIGDLSIYDEGISTHMLVNNYTFYEYTSDKLFEQRYKVMQGLSKMTEIRDTNESTLLVMQNDITHCEAYLTDDTYEPGGEVVESEPNRTINGITMKMEDSSQVLFYRVNMCAFIQLAKWFDYLQENDVYDNTRIILVSDHGYSLYQFDELWMAEGRDVQFVNPLLMVKDFGATGELKTNTQFMTNADVPAIAVDRLIDKAVNPATGKIINNKAKKEGAQVLTTSDNWYIKTNNGCVFDMSDGNLWSIHSDIANPEFWEKLN